MYDMTPWKNVSHCLAPFNLHISLCQVWWAASDFGWVVGHSYICYGPLLHGNTTVLYEVRDKNVRVWMCYSIWPMDRTS